MTDKHILSKRTKRSSVRLQRYSLQLTPLKQDAEYVAKIQAIVNSLNHSCLSGIRLHLDINCEKGIEEDLRFFRAVEIERHGLQYIKERERRIKKTIDGYGPYELSPNDSPILREEKRQCEASAYSTEEQYRRADKLNSQIEDCNLYLLRKVQLSLDIHEIKKKGGKELR